MDPSMDSKLVAQSLNFHGQQLQKIWDGEREGELAKLNVTDLDFAVYQERQKQLSFQDRAKRLKLQQFLVKKANVLFDSSYVDVPWGGHGATSGAGEEDFYAVMPPYETFLRVDKATRVRHFYQCLQRGDTIIASVANKQATGHVVKVLFVEGENPRFAADLSIKALCVSASIPPALDKKNGNRGIICGDFIRAEVMEVHPDAEKIICGLKSSSSREGGGDASPSTSEGQPRLGLIRSEDFPEPLNICNNKDNTMGFEAKETEGSIALSIAQVCAIPPPSNEGMVVPIDKNTGTRTKTTLLDVIFLFQQIQ